MNKSRLLVAVRVFAFFLITTAANSASIVNLSTGVDGAGNLISLGGADDIWQLTDAPVGVSTGNAIVADSGRPFFNLEPNARWISGSELLASVDAPWGLYTYKATFDTSGYTNFSIDGLFGSDNRLIDVRLNGMLAIEGPNKYGPCASNGCEEFTSPIAFLIDDPGLFVSGLNAIEFIIENQGPTSGNPTSFILNASVSGSAVPIPPALYLFGTGLLGMFRVARKRQQS